LPDANNRPGRLSRLSNTPAFDVCLEAIGRLKSTLDAFTDCRALEIVSREEETGGGALMTVSKRRAKAAGATPLSGQTYGAKGG
jgi:hypothetical protein